MFLKIKEFFRKYPSARYLLSSGFAWVVDNGLYYIFLFVFGAFQALTDVGISTASQVLARALSSFVNFNMNNFFVFQSDEKYSKAIIKYYCLCIPQAAVSVLIMDVLIGNLDLSSNLLKLTLKIIVEAVLFVIGYFIQNRWVFRKKNNE